MGYPTNLAADVGVMATIPGAWWFHMIGEGLRAVIVDAGLLPSATDLQRLSDALRRRFAPRRVGEVVWSATGTALEGTVLCDGGVLSRADYADLYQCMVVDPGFVPHGVTMSTGTPGVFTHVGHGFGGGERLRFSTTGALLTGITVIYDYFVIRIDDDNFGVSGYRQGAALALSGSQSGSHSYLRSIWGLGDGTTTFNTPNLMGHFVRSTSAGQPVGVWSTGMVESHFHFTEKTSTIYGYQNPGFGNVGGNDFGQSGAYGGSETRPESISLTPCITY
jgi:microcystin-dependent protein